MPSIFSRSRTNSTPKKPTADVAYDEFGRVTSRGSAKGTGLLSTSKKDKKSKDKSRSKNGHSPAEPEAPEPHVPDGSFLSLNLDPQRYEPGEEPSQERRQLLDYGYLSHQRNVVLGLEEVARLVDVVGHELDSRALTTPFIFSSLALDISSSAVKRLIDAFLKTCTSHRCQEADKHWREEAALAGPHELGMCLRWGLARIVRIVGGQEVRGLLSYKTYFEWCQAEAALNYPPTYFAHFVASLDPLLQSLLVGLFELLSKFAAHSASSGHTPPTLSPLFGPLLFGLGPSTLAFHHVYMHYLRAVSATEHLILAFIRYQDAPGAGGSSATTLGVPTRLKAWIKGYPSMLPAINPLERPQPRRGARTMRVVSVRRNVRMYSTDLVKTAASWGQRPRGPTSPSDRTFATSREWERICPPTLKLAPRYSDSFRKRMDLSSGFHPDMGITSSSSTISNAPSLSSSISTSSTASSLFEDKELGSLMGSMGNRTPEDRFRNLSDLRWGEFEAVGFGGLSDHKKLEFDLTESARAARSAKRATLSWQDFSSAGFSRTDAPLSATLQFSSPVATQISSWPAQSQELHRKLKKTQKALPAFGWDTEPVVGSEEVIEEAFIDVFCDLIYGSGWLDVERVEEANRECNWALVEFKSLPLSKTTAAGTSDPRTSTTLILFEEFVPLEYRHQLYVTGSARPRLPSLFGTSSRKQWKPAPTLNGRPYVIGHVPHSPSYREVEFEGMLRQNESRTKVLTLKVPDRSHSLKTVTPLASTVTSPVQQPKPNLFLAPVADNPIQRTSSRTSETSDSPQGRSSTPVQGSPTVNRRSMRIRLPLSPSSGRRDLQPAEYENVDFHTRLASLDTDDLQAPSGKSRDRRRKSRDDAWVDILVNSSRRLDAQDAELRGGGGGLRGGRSDPELASQEVSEVLAMVRGQVISDDEDSVMEPVHDEHLDDGVSEVDQDTIPASSIAGSFAEDLDDQYAYDEEDEAELAPIQPRRLGYFDLHPDRKPSQGNITDQIASTSQTQTPELRVEPPQEDIPRASFESDASMYDKSEEAHGGLETSRKTLRPLPTLPGNSAIPTLRSASPRQLPAPSLPQGPAAPVPVAPAAGPSKTASLIEMYRERERGGAQTGPSKLPIRTALTSRCRRPGRAPWPRATRT
ncbi:hypothetical protein PHLGIDRAFT_94961 [Phlebiopsis gigantea 11061_1 CR5-6]|uniref:Meiotically up-regulated protein Msb1/Mug8 domain-containing protein n=1 Tax=Phlebiopsis gigantea (strain 11061_1 CR5-6) TaxID=745531 RepID=A0A0C3S540_PHLG1|nr:hypothetical protein PHLGIDRAFT_94961 [Phlebiopsis gigantea 11061_1 CR5-6]